MGNGGHRIDNLYLPQIIVQCVIPWIHTCICQYIDGQVVQRCGAVSAPIVCLVEIGNCITGTKAHTVVIGLPRVQIELRTVQPLDGAVCQCYTILDFNLLADLQII